jgi:hypothetical protein
LPVAGDLAPVRADAPGSEPARLEIASQPVEAHARAAAGAAVAEDREREHLRPADAIHPASGGDPAATTPQDAVPHHATGGWAGDDSRPTCTVAQLRRFIKSRPWVPMHELRRRFGINGVEDDVSPIRVRDERLYIGLPLPEARLMAELLAGGDVGYELSLDPGAPVVVGVYPMRPVPRS